MGPFRQWPTGSGFEYFYGFIGGETNQWYPALYEGTTPVEPPKTPEEGYHLTDDMTDQAIALGAPAEVVGARQAVLHVLRPRSDARAAPRAQGMVRQVQGQVRRRLGRAPRADARSSERARRRSARHRAHARPAEIPAWDDMPDALKPVLARQMEVYAGFMEHTDYHVGRLIDALESSTCSTTRSIYYIIGDNGASAEGTPNGTFNEMLSLNGAAEFETPEFMAERIDEFGDTEAYNHYAVGWAHAMDTPYQWTKQVASHFGGTRNGTIVHWPNGFEARGEIRSQFHHIIDVAADDPRRCRVPEPSFVNGIQQMPLHGVGMPYCFDDAEAPNAARRSTSRCSATAASITRVGPRSPGTASPWVLSGVCRPSTTTCGNSTTPTTDWSQAHDLANEHPDKLHELQRLWLIEAVKYNVLPLDDRRIERFNSDLAGRPELVQGNAQMLFGGMGRLSENSVLNLKNKSHSVTAEIVVPDGGANGVIIAQGGAFAGWCLYLHEGKPDVLPQPAQAPAFQRRGRRRRCRPAPIRCGWSSPTTVAALGRAAPSRSTSTAEMSAKAASTRRFR